MGRPAKSAIAILVALGVCLVLITPAFDELPSTLPHAFHHAVALGAAAVSLVAQAKPVVLKPLTPDTALPGVDDVQSLMCTRLC